MPDVWEMAERALATYQQASESTPLDEAGYMLQYLAFILQNPTLDVVIWVAVGR